MENRFTLMRLSFGEFSNHQKKKKKKTLNITWLMRGDQQVRYQGFTRGPIAPGRDLLRD